MLYKIVSDFVSVENMISPFLDFNNKLFQTSDPRSFEVFSKSLNSEQSLIINSTWFVQNFAIL